MDSDSVCEQPRDENLGDHLGVVWLVTDAILNFIQAGRDVTLAVMTQPMFCLETLLPSWLQASNATDRFEGREEQLVLLLQQINPITISKFKEKTENNQEE